jgi:hypothetical protein
MRNSQLARALLTLSIILAANPGDAQNQPSPTAPAPAAPGPLATNVQITLEAWTAFRAGDNETAVTKADQCIRQFRDVADRIQTRLNLQKESLPMGTASPSDKKRVDQYEVLHNVARCFLIKGLAEEKLNHFDAARTAYAEATRYKHARIHDPATDSFWSPAEKAAERLADSKNPLQ